MKPIEQIKQELREKIIMARHPECKTIDEALRKEIDFGCIMENKIENNIWFIPWDRKEIIEDEELDNILSRNKIIGLPIYLHDVLRGLEMKTNGELIYTRQGIREIVYLDGSMDIIAICNWDLTKNLEEQAEETQRTINEILTK